MGKPAARSLSSRLFATRDAPAAAGVGSYGYARRVHGEVVGPPARREIERAGWRTRLEFAEQRNRARDGTLVGVEERWTAEAQRFDGETMLAQASASTAELAWTALLEQIERGQITHHRRVRFA